MRTIAWLFCILLVTGCSEKDRIPSNVIGKEEMGSILWDMMQADQYAANYLIKDSARVNVKMETLKLYEEVFRLHNVTRDEFRKSFQFYQDRPDITRVLFDSLIQRGNRLRAESYTHPSAPASTPSVPVVKPPGAGFIPSVRFPSGKDSARYQGKGRGIKFLPGRPSQSPSGAHPDSLSKNKH